MPVDVAVEEPWSRVVSKEPNGDNVGGARANAYDIANDRVDEIIGRVASAADYVEGVLVGDTLANGTEIPTHLVAYPVQMYRMLKL
jgi:hypothetical protein